MKLLKDIALPDGFDLDDGHRVEVDQEPDLILESCTFTTALDFDAATNALDALLRRHCGPPTRSGGDISRVLSCSRHAQDITAQVTDFGDHSGGYLHSRIAWSSAEAGSAAPIQTDDKAEDERRIRALVDLWQSATKAGDIDTVLSLMTDDAIFLVPGRAPVGKAEFAELSRVPPGAPRPAFESTSEIMEMQVSGDMAFLWSRLSVRVTPPGADAPIGRAGHTLTVFRRIDGQWLLARDANLLVVVPYKDP
ncbi:MAG: YybH family protein [Lysobacteraceae bacterium]